MSAEWNGLSGMRVAQASMLHDQNVRAELKGAKGGNCNVTACQKPGAIFFNKSTRAYYCGDCAKEINWPGGRELTMDIYGTPLLCEVDDDEDFMALMRQTANDDQRPLSVRDTTLSMTHGEFNQALIDRGTNQARSAAREITVHKGRSVGISTTSNANQNDGILQNIGNDRTLIVDGFNHPGWSNIEDAFRGLTWGTKPSPIRIHTGPRLSKTEKKAAKKARRA